MIRINTEASVTMKSLLGFYNCSSCRHKLVAIHIQTNWLCCASSIDPKKRPQEIILKPDRFRFCQVRILDEE
ncbi:hypothetical protein ACHAXH_009843 [Discostella pseudostelligera]